FLRGRIILLLQSAEASRPVKDIRHLSAHFFKVLVRCPFRLLEVRQLLQASLGIGTGFGAGGWVLNTVALYKNNDGQGWNVVRLNLQDLLGNLLNFLLISGLLVG